VTSDFTARVLHIVRRIPAGRVATYGEVAALAGHPGAARAVGSVMRKSGRSGVPCHRVIAAGGRLGGYGGNEAIKRALLVAEGVVVVGSRIRNLAAVKAVFRSVSRAGPSARRRGHTGSSKPTQSAP
jgi:O-6-methylguanine DNA methyltransferase